MMRAKASEGISLGGVRGIDDSAATPDASRALLRAMFDAAIDSALPSRCVPPHLPTLPRGRTIVIGAGKAAAAMARAVEDHWQGPLSGVVVTRYGHAVSCRSIDVLEAAHPVPDAAGVAAARRIMAAVQGLNADDLVICLISGGGSALLPALPPGVSLDDEQTLSRALLASGATIAEMNCVRKHVSLVKGGRLAALAAPAQVVTLAISDVPGDDPGTIASGPTVPNTSSRAEAMAIIGRYGITLPPAIAAWLGCAERETPKPTSEPDFRLIAAPQLALEAAARVARAAGFEPVILGDAIEGEARDVGAVQARLVREQGPGPHVLLSGGETTVTVRANGRGGRNVEFLLGLAIALDGSPDVTALAADTDGIDGTEDNAGAFVDETTLERGAAFGLDARDHLLRNDAYSYFERLGDLLVTGATLTNVNDFRAIVVGAPAVAGGG